MRISQLSIDEQAEYYKVHNISHAEQIKLIHQLNKWFFLKKNTGYFDYRHNPLTDNWDIFDLLIENLLIVMKLKLLDAEL